ncbi:hypothetical protein [Microcystis aeruginosa]|uniref:hypothetical protein n=1 Tax=Microcystis aeruginosa TaxID=1126 RepID=UPI00187E09F3|nr:hypothetical protein [Microcystis aeruginosa]
MDPCLAIGYRLSRRGYGWGLIILIIVLIPASARSGGNKHNKLQKTGFFKKPAFSTAIKPYHCLAFALTGV